MSKWTVIDLDRDIVTKEILGITQAMKVPDGMIIRTSGHDAMAMVFVPQSRGPGGTAITDTWIEDNKIDI